VGITAAAMVCTEFIERFSDYFDGVGDGEFMKNAEAHLSSCCSCRRYVEVVARGSELIRSAPSLNVSRDFYPRLRHRIFHVDDAEVLSRGSVGSATNAVTILGMAVLLTLVAWAPVMLARPSVELPPIVVSHPASKRPIGLRPAPVRLSTDDAALYGRRFERDALLWEHPHSLLLRYSSLFERYPNGAFRLTGLD
jgi:hypothetical protein